jgi:predicted nucleic acid-binding protein
VTTPVPGSFVDSNVVLHLASRDSQKAERAEQLLRAGVAISVQVLNEVANVARRRFGMSWAETREFLTGLRALASVRAVTVETHESGLRLAERYGLAIHDAMIAAAALTSDCDTLWSEDMHHGLVIDGRLRILNPFRTTA